MYQVLLWDTSLYGFIWLFLIYSFLGWCAEVAAHAVTKGKFINRGVLNGPYCPIYGFGMVLVIICLTPIEYNLILLFIGATILTTVLELVTGVVLEQVFHTKWWDYSNQKYNLKGYICLKYSIVWGAACVVVMKIIDPLIVDFIKIIPQLLGQILIIIFLLIMLADMITMIISLTGMSKRAKRSEQIRERIHKGSDKIGSKIADETLEIQEKVDQLPDKKNAIQRRLENAYPALAEFNKKTSKEELKLLLKDKIDNITKKEK